jgi:flavodoxin
MTSLVVYSSQSGNTRKLAEAVFETLGGKKEIYPVADAPGAEGYDLIFLGFWLKAGKPDPDSAEYLARVGNARLFLFATHGAAGGSEHAQNAMAAARSLAADADLVGSFSCQGEVIPKMLEKAGSKPQPPVWLADAPDAVGHPDQKDIEALKNCISELLPDIAGK